MREGLDVQLEPIKCSMTHISTCEAAAADAAAAGAAAQRQKILVKVNFFVNLHDFRIYGSSSSIL